MHPSNGSIRHESGSWVRPPRLLIIDDEPLLGLALLRALEGRCDVVVVTTAADALALLRAGERYDVLLCDMDMPRMDGIGFYDHVVGATPDVARHIIFTSGNFSLPRFEAFGRSVPNLLLEKPVDVDGLVALIERRTGRGRRGDADVPQGSVGVARLAS